MVLSTQQHNTLLQLGWKDVKVNLYESCTYVEEGHKVCDMIIVKSLDEIILLENLMDNHEWFQQELKFSNLHNLIKYLYNVT